MSASHGTNRGGSASSAGRRVTRSPRRTGPNMGPQNSQSMRITFLGAASTVTGSQFLLETARAKVLVDCGMFQGNPHETEHNRAPLAYDPAAIDAMLLTHAHLDHCGLIPLVHAKGLRAPIFATAGTVELATLVLLDSAKLQEEFAERSARRASRGGDGAGGADDEEAAAANADAARDPERAVRAQPPSATTTIDRPLYTTAQAEASLASFRPIEYGREFAVASR